MRTKMFLCTILVFTMLLPASLLAQEKQKGKHHPMKEKWAQLELTAEQETKLKELHKQAAPARKERMKKMEEVREKIKAELLKEKPSQKVLDDCAAEMGDLHEQMNASSIEHLLEVKEILTPEQFKKFTEKGPVGGGHERMRKHKDYDKGKGGSDCKKNK